MQNVIMCDNSDNSKQLIIAKGLPKALNALTIARSNLMTQLEPAKFVISLRPKLQWSNSDKKYHYQMHAKVKNSEHCAVKAISKTPLTCAVKAISKTPLNNLPQLTDKKFHCLSETSIVKINDLSATSLVKFIQSTTYELKATQSVTDLSRLSAGDSGSRKSTEQDPRKSVNFLQPGETKERESLEQARKSKKQKKSKQSKKLKESEESQELDKSKQSEESKQSGESKQSDKARQSEESSDMSPRRKSELTACRSEEMVNELKNTKGTRPFRRKKEHLHENMKPCKPEIIDYTKGTEPIQEGLLYRLQKPIDKSIVAEAQVEVPKDKCCRIDSLEHQMHKMRQELKYIKQECVPQVHSKRITELTNQLQELNSFLSDFKHSCFKKKLEQNSEVDEVEEKLEMIQNLQSHPTNLLNETEKGCACEKGESSMQQPVELKKKVSYADDSHVKELKVQKCQTEEASSVIATPGATKTSTTESNRCEIGPLPDAVPRYDQIRIVNDYRVDPELRRLRLQSRSQVKDIISVPRQYPEITICKEESDDEREPKFKQNDTKKDKQTDDHVNDTKNKCEIIEWDNTPVSPAEDSYPETTSKEPYRLFESKRRKWRFSRKKKPKESSQSTLYFSADEKVECTTSVPRTAEVKIDSKHVLELPESSNRKRNTANGSDAQCNGCEMCINTKLPILKSNLNDAIYNLIDDLETSLIALTILLQKDNLYHINLSMLHTGQSLGCLYATEECIVEANKQHVFEEFLTFFVVDSMNTMEQKNKILSHSFDFIRN